MLSVYDDNDVLGVCHCGCFLFFVEGYYDREGLDQLTGSSSRMTLAFFFLTFSRDSMSAPGALIGTVHAHECCVTLARAR